MVDEIKLKPCPFCGGEPVMSSWECGDTHYEDYYVMCQHCVAETAHDLTKEKAAETWNTRTNQDKAKGDNKMNQYATSKLINGKFYGWLEQFACLVKNGVLSAGDTLGVPEDLRTLKLMGVCKQTRSGWYALTPEGVDLATELGWIHI